MKCRIAGIDNFIGIQHAWFRAKQRRYHANVEGRGRMEFMHRCVYERLVKDGRFSATRQNYKNPYVCITQKQRAGQGHSMILYSPDSREGKTPYHYDDNRESYDHSVAARLRPVITEVRYDRPGSTRNWHCCKVLSWEGFAEAIGLGDTTVGD
jgi:hypothetical protein